MCLMFVSNDSFLIWNSNRDVCLIVEYNTLTAKATFDTGVNGAVNKILFFVRDSFQKRLSFFDIHMAGRTCTNPAAVVVEVYIVFLRQFKDGHIFKVALDGFWSNIRVFKLKVDNSHKLVVRSSFRGFPLKKGLQR